jgi:hypothetical protein
MNTKSHPMSSDLMLTQYSPSKLGFVEGFIRLGGMRAVTYKTLNPKPIITNMDQVPVASVKAGM